jgi:hypothetical protein
MSFRLIASTTVVLVAAGSFAVPASALPEATPPILQLAQTLQQDDLVAFAAAAVQIQEIQTTMLNEAEGATPEEATRLQAEAQAAMVGAVEEQGLTVEQYNSIAQLVRADPNIAETVDTLIQQQLGG